MKLSVWVATPTFWWRADSFAIRAWVPVDPDVEDGGDRQELKWPLITRAVVALRRLVPVAPDVKVRNRRWDDRYEQRWPLIAQAVAAVGAALADHAWRVDPDGNSDQGLVTVDMDASDMTATERRIVTSWFSAGEGVRADPWCRPILNGRHRLWSTLPHFGPEPIPMVSRALTYATPDGLASVDPDWPKLYADHLEQIRALEWFDASDALHARFLRTLETASAGDFPSPV